MILTALKTKLGLSLITGASLLFGSMMVYVSIIKNQNTRLQSQNEQYKKDLSSWKVSYDQLLITFKMSEKLLEEQRDYAKLLRKQTVTLTEYLEKFKHENSEARKWFSTPLPESIIRAGKRLRNYKEPSTKDR